MNDAQIYHEIRVTAESPMGSETVTNFYHLDTPLEGSSAVEIGECCQACPAAVRVVHFLGAVPLTT